MWHEVTIDVKEKLETCKEKKEKVVRVTRGEKESMMKLEEREDLE